MENEDPIPEEFHELLKDVNQELRGCGIKKRKVNDDVLVLSTWVLAYMGNGYLAPRSSKEKAQLSGDGWDSSTIRKKEKRLSSEIKEGLDNGCN